MKIIRNRKNKFFTVLILILLIFTSYFVNASRVQSTEKQIETQSYLLNIDPDIIIPVDYPTIQEGIANSEEGFTILVLSGIYKENIEIDKKDLYLIGENKFDTIIDIENKSHDAVIITADGVKIQGFTIKNARYEKNVIWNQSGIAIFSSNVTVIDNIISYNRLGVTSFTNSYNITISDNMFFFDGLFPGCYINCIDGHYEATDNIPLESLYINVTNNTINGKPLYYLQDIHDIIVNSDAGQVILINCTNVTVKNLYLNKIDFSVMLYYCHNCLVENITIIDTEGELILFFSENNTIQNNKIKNAFHGVCLDIGSKNNDVRYNEIFDSMQGITILTFCTGNKIYSNKIYNTEWGMKITSYTKNAPSHDNLIFDNEFYKNGVGIILLLTFHDPLCYTYNNTISNNIFLKNFIGLEIDTSKGNNITDNIFKRNLISACFINCSNNYWNNNYWNRPRLLPKPIIGFMMLGKIPIPYKLNFDMHPARFL